MPGGRITSKVSNADLLDNINNLHKAINGVSQDVNGLKVDVGELKTTVKTLDICIRGDGLEKKGLVGRLDRLDWITGLMIKVIAPAGTFMIVTDIILWFEHHGLTGLFSIK